MHGTSNLAALAEGHATETLAEADRLMTVCNSCRYCEGLCAVFPAMEMRRAFSDGEPQLPRQSLSFLRRLLL
jgi:citrate/tricarballylate utilization protein